MYSPGFNPLNQVYRLNHTATDVTGEEARAGFNPLNQVYRLNLNTIEKIFIRIPQGFNPLNQVYRLNKVLRYQNQELIHVLIP